MLPSSSILSMCACIQAVQGAPTSDERNVQELTEERIDDESPEVMDREEVNDDIAEDGSIGDRRDADENDVGVNDDADDGSDEDADDLDAGEDEGDDEVNNRRKRFAQSYNKGYGWYGGKKGGHHNGYGQKYHYNKHVYNNSNKRYRYNNGNTPGVYYNNKYSRKSFGLYYKNGGRNNYGGYKNQGYW